jgi:hypothetical protein
LNLRCWWAPNSAFLYTYPLIDLTGFWLSPPPRNCHPSEMTANDPWPWWLLLTFGTWCPLSCHLKSTCLNLVILLPSAPRLSPPLGYRRLAQIDNWLPSRELPSQVTSTMWLAFGFINASSTESHKKSSVNVSTPVYLDSPIENILSLGFFGGTGVWTQGFRVAKQVLYSLSHVSSPSCSGYFRDGVSWTFCPGWPQTLHPLILLSQPPK